jgi:hypothetical protein
VIGQLLIILPDVIFKLTGVNVKIHAKQLMGKGISDRVGLRSLLEPKINPKLTQN